MPSAKIHGTDFYYIERGAGPALLLIHGAGGNADLWSDVIEPLSRGHRVIAYDRRGYTRTQTAPADPENYLEQQGDDAAALLLALDATPAIVLGWSGGGLSALHAASRHPTLVQQLILEEPPYQLFKYATPDVLSFFGQVQRLAQAGQIREAAETFYRWAMSYTSGGTGFDKLKPELREATLANAATLLVELQAGTGESLTAERLATITCPVTCLVGELTPQPIRDATARLRPLLTEAEVVRIAGAAHGMHLDQPGRFVEAVIEAIGKHAPA